jgi:hypothetical protein
MVYKYYLRVVPATYVAPRIEPLHTKYSLTHYERLLKPHLGVLGISFKFDVEQSIVSPSFTTFSQSFIWCVTILPSAYPHHLISVP